MRSPPVKSQTVALYFQSLSRKGGGAERRIIDLANRLAVAGKTVYIISLDDIGAKSFYNISDDVVWLKVGFKQGFLDKLRRVLELTRIFMRHKIDTFIGFVASSDFTVYFACHFVRVRMILAERNSPLMYALLMGNGRRVLTMTMMGTSNKIVVQQEEFVDMYPKFLRNRVYVIPNPVDNVKFVSNLQPTADGFYEILYVGRLEPFQKRVDFLLRAFVDIARDFPNWRLRFVGDGMLGQLISDCIKEFDLSRQIIVSETVKDVGYYYASASLFVMPSRWEGFPNSLLEALSHGLPAITFDDSSGVSTLVRESGGWVVDSQGGVRGLARTLETAMEDRDELLSRSSKARAYAQSRSKTGGINDWLEVMDI